MDPTGEWLELGRLDDIDTVADIAPVRAQLDSLIDATDEQVALGKLLGELSAIAEPCS